MGATLRSCWNRIVLSVEWVARRSVFIALTTFLGVFLGLWGSLYTAEIKTGFPFRMDIQGTPCEAWFFWGLLLVFTTCFLFTQWAQNRSTSRAQGELIERSDQLARLIKTLPPEGFLAKFETFYRNCFASVRVVSTPGAPVDAIEEAVRINLNCIVSLADYFDGNPSDAEYGANIMLFVESAQLGATAAANIKDRLRFAPNATDLRQLRGVLDLQRPLSTTTESEDPEPDASLPPLALPIPHSCDAVKEVNSLRRYRVLPGAPLAFCENKIVGFHNVADLKTWCLEEGDFPPGLVQDMISHFETGAGRKIKSFVSIPLIRSGEDEPMGILNIHRDVAGLLNEKGTELFVPLTAPFRLLLVQLLDLRRQETITNNEPDQLPASAPVTLSDPSEAQGHERT